MASEETTPQDAPAVAPQEETPQKEVPSTDNGNDTAPTESKTEPAQDGAEAQPVNEGVPAQPANGADPAPGAAHDPVSAGDEYVPLATEPAADNAQQPTPSQGEQQMQPDQLARQQVESIAQQANPNQPALGQPGLQQQQQHDGAGAPGLQQQHDGAGAPARANPNERQCRTLFVRGLALATNEGVLEREFGVFGEIEGIKVMKPNGANIQTAYGFVTFKELDAAVLAKGSMQGRSINGREIEIEFGKSETRRLDGKGGDRGRNEQKPDRNEKRGAARVADASRTLHLKDLDPSVDERMIEQHFARYGVIETIKLFRDVRTKNNQILNYAFVNFLRVEEATSAMLALDGRKLGPKVCYLEYGRPPTKEVAGIVPGPGFSKGGRDSSRGGGDAPVRARSLWVGGITTDLSDDYLYREFSRFGPVDDLRVRRQSSCMFVDYRHPEDASLAIRTMNGARLGNATLKIEVQAKEKNLVSQDSGGKPKGVGKPTDTLWVQFQRYSQGQTDEKQIQADIHRIFTHFGRVVECKTLPDRPYAFVTMSCIEECEAIVDEFYYNDQDGSRRFRAFNDHIKIEYSSKGDPNNRKRPARDDGYERSRKRGRYDSGPASPPLGRNISRVDRSVCVFRGALQKGEVRSNIDGFRIRGEVPRYLDTLFDMTQRIDIASFFERREHMRAACIIELAPASPHDERGYSEVIQYLKERNRAGCCYTRDFTVYLLPPDDRAADTMEIAYTNCLVAVVVPAAPAPGGGYGRDYDPRGPPMDHRGPERMDDRRDRWGPPQGGYEPRYDSHPPPGPGGPPPVGGYPPMPMATMGMGAPGMSPPHMNQPPPMGAPPAMFPPQQGPPPAANPAPGANPGAAANLLANPNIANQLLTLLQNHNQRR